MITNISSAKKKKKLPVKLEVSVWLEGLLRDTVSCLSTYLNKAELFRHLNRTQLTQKA